MAIATSTKERSHASHNAVTPYWMRRNKSGREQASKKREVEGTAENPHLLISSLSLSSSSFFRMVSLIHKICFLFPMHCPFLELFLPFGRALFSEALSSHQVFPSCLPSPFLPLTPSSLFLTLTLFCALRCSAESTG